MRVRLCVAVFGLAAMDASGQSIFFDNFNGTRLLPHWEQPPPEHWEHTVSGGLLTVTGLFHPGIPGELNSAKIGAEFPQWTHFYEATASIGWEAGAGRRLGVRLGDVDAALVSMGYDEVTGPEASIFVHVKGQFPFSIPAPAPGIHEFRCVVDGDVVVFYLDGVFQKRFFTGTGHGARDITS